VNKKCFAICAATAAMALGATSGLAQTCPVPGTDRDGDGFDDALECLGIPLVNGTIVRTDSTTKDVFVVVHLASNSLIQQIFGTTTPFNPFNQATYVGSGVNVTFNGLAPLGVNVRVLSDADTFGDRLIDTSPNGSQQKAVRIAESTDPNGTILGNCQWGTPDELDGCVVYSTRIKNFIDATCLKNSPDELTLMFKAYVTQSFLHEVGHSLGGLASTYNSRTGGYHYKSGSGFVMDQSVSYIAKNGLCTWNISSTWNQAADPQSVRLK